MKYLLGIILLVLLLLLFFIPDKHISIKTNHVVRGSEIENFETEDIRSPYISPIDEMCKFGDTITCSKDKSIIESAERREEIGSYAEKECGVDLDNIRPECDVHVTGDAIFQRVVFANFDDDKYKVVDPTEFTNEHSFPLLQMSNDGEFEMVEHKAEFDKMENEMNKLPFLQDNRCKFVIDNVSDHNNYPFFTDNKLLNHPDGPKEPNLCYIPPSVVNVLFAKQDKAADPNYKLCSSDNELIYHSRYNDIVEIVGMDVSKHIDKDIGTPMCVLKFKDKDDDVSDSEYSEKISEYLNFLHGKDPELQVRQGGYSWIRDKFNLDKKIIDKQNEDEIKMASIVVDTINNSDGLANHLLGYNADPNKYINDYVMHAIDDKYNPEHGIDRNGDPIRELNMSYNCAYHGTDGKDLNDKPYSKNYIDFKGVGSHLSHLETQDLNTYLDRWSEYGDPINKKNQMNKYVKDNAVFTNVWDRNEGKDDIDSKENKCEKTLLKREGEEGNYPDPWLGFHRIDETLFDGNKSSFLYRNDTSGLENYAERYYRQGCEWHHLQHIDKYSESNRRSESCDWVASRNIDFNCKEFGKMFVNEKENPVDKYYTSLSREKGYEDADESIVDFLLNTSDPNIRKFSKDGNRCVYRDENNDGCVTESDLPLLPSPNVENRVPIFGSGAIINDDTNFVWGSNLEVKGDSVNGYVISGNPMPHIEPKLSSVLNIQEDPTTKESNITLGDEYMVIASNGTVAYVLRDTSDHDSFDRDPNIKLKITKADPEYNGNTSVLNPPGTLYDYTLGSGKCVISNDKMIVDKNSWIDGSFNAGKIQVGDFVKRSRDVLKNDPSNPMDSTVVCDIDKDNLVEGGTYEATVGNEVKLTPYTCEVTKPSNSTIHLSNDGSDGKDFTSYINAKNYDNTRAYKFINKGTYGDFNGIGSSLLYIDQNSKQKDIQVNDINKLISTILPGKVYEYSGDGKFKYDKFAICDSAGVSINNGICEADVETCPDNPGPKSVGLYHYTNYPQYNRVDQGVYVYKNNNTLQRVPSGLSNLDIDKLTFSKVECTDLGAALSKFTSSSYNNSCDIRRITKSGNNDTITSAADPVDKNEAGECVIGSDYVVVGKSSWDKYSNTLIQPKDTNGGNEALSNIFQFQKYGILPNTNILQDAGREELENERSLSDAEKACDDDKTCKGIQHVIDANKYFKFKNLESEFLEPNGNSTIYVKRAECGTECLEYCSDPEYAKRNTSNVFLEETGVILKGTNIIGGVNNFEQAKFYCSENNQCIGFEKVGGSYTFGNSIVVDNTSTRQIHRKYKACGSKLSSVSLNIIKLDDNLIRTSVHFKVNGSPGRYFTGSTDNEEDFLLVDSVLNTVPDTAERYKIIPVDDYFIINNDMYMKYYVMFVDERFAKFYVGTNDKFTFIETESAIIEKVNVINEFIFIPHVNGYQICLVRGVNMYYLNMDFLNFESKKNTESLSIVIAGEYITESTKTWYGDVIIQLGYQFVGQTIEKTKNDNFTLDTNTTNHYLHVENNTVKIIDHASLLSIKIPQNNCEVNGDSIINMNKKYKIVSLYGKNVILIPSIDNRVSILELNNNKYPIGYWSYRINIDPNIIQEGIYYYYQEYKLINFFTFGYTKFGRVFGSFRYDEFYTDFRILKSPSIILSSITENIVGPVWLKLAYDFQQPYINFGFEVEDKTTTFNAQRFKIKPVNNEFVSIGMKKYQVYVIHLHWDENEFLKINTDFAIDANNNTSEYKHDPTWRGTETGKVIFFPVHKGYVILSKNKQFYFELNSKLMIKKLIKLDDLTTITQPSELNTNHINIFQIETVELKSKETGDRINLWGITNNIYTITNYSNSNIGVTSDIKSDTQFKITKYAERGSDMCLELSNDPDIKLIRGPGSNKAIFANTYSGGRSKIQIISNDNQTHLILSTLDESYSDINLPHMLGADGYWRKMDPCDQWNPPYFFLWRFANIPPVTSVTPVNPLPKSITHTHKNSAHGNSSTTTHSHPISGIVNLHVQGITHLI